MRFGAVVFATTGFAICPALAARSWTYERIPASGQPMVDSSAPRHPQKAYPRSPGHEQPMVDSSTAQHPQKAYIQVAGVVIPPDPAVVTPVIRRAMLEGRFETEEARQIPRIVRPGDRVLEIGAGIGFISTLLSRERRVASVLAVEANPHLIDYMVRLHARNRVRKVRRLNAVLTNEPVAEHDLLPAAGLLDGLADARPEPLRRHASRSRPATSNALLQRRGDRPDRLRRRGRGGGALRGRRPCRRRPHLRRAARPRHRALGGRPALRHAGRPRASSTTRAIPSGSVVLFQRVGPKDLCAPTPADPPTHRTAAAISARLRHRPIGLLASAARPRLYRPAHQRQVDLTDRPPPEVANGPRARFFVAHGASAWPISSPKPPSTGASPASSRPTIEGLGFELVRLRLMGGKRPAAADHGRAARGRHRGRGLRPHQPRGLGGARRRGPDQRRIRARGVEPGHRPAADPARRTSSARPATRPGSRPPSRSTAAAASRACSRASQDGEVLVDDPGGHHRPRLRR